MRISSALLLPAMLGGCGSGSPTVVPTQSSVAVEDDAVRVACAHEGGAMVPNCVVEQVGMPAGPVLTLRHPDGAFRRLRITTDGHGVVAADGAQTAAVSMAGDDIDVAIDGDRYRLPATIRPGTR